MTFHCRVKKRRIEFSDRFMDQTQNLSGSELKKVLGIYQEISKNIKNGLLDEGCPGNTLGLSKLLEGMNIDEAISKLKGIPCGMKKSSCPNEISKALEEYLVAHK